MTNPQKGKRLFVASEQLSHAVEFAEMNSIERHNLFWLGSPVHKIAVNDITEIWVLGTIGQRTAEEVHLMVQRTGAKVRYADWVDRIALTGPSDAA